jgi:hypothetical protein
MRNIAKWIRYTPQPLLRSYFSSRYPEARTSIGESEISTTAEALLTHIEKLNPEVRANLLADIERMLLVADGCSDNVVSILDESEWDCFQQLENRYARSVWLFMHDQTRFRQMEEARYTDYYRDSNIYAGFSGPVWASIALDQLGVFRQRIAKLMGCYGQLHIEHSLHFASTNGNGQAQLFQMSVFYEGLPDSYLAFEGGNIRLRHRRPVYEMVITYDAVTGVIEVDATHSEMCEDIARLFCETLLRHPMEMERISLRRYRLDTLLTQKKLLVDVTDGIESVRITSLTVKPTTGKNSITLQISAREHRSIFEVARAWFQQHNPLENGFIVQQAILMIKFYKVRGQGKARVLSVKITNPNGCNLNGHTERERLLGEKYLKAWGLVGELV